MTLQLLYPIENYFPCVGISATLDGKSVTIVLKDNAQHRNENYEFCFYLAQEETRFIWSARINETSLAGEARRMVQKPTAIKSSKEVILTPNQ